MKCEFCDDQDGTMRCDECEMTYCDFCCQRRHKKGAMKAHTPVPYVGDEEDGDDAPPPPEEDLPPPPQEASDEEEEDDDMPPPPLSDDDDELLPPPPEEEEDEEEEEAEAEEEEEAEEEAEGVEEVEPSTEPSEEDEEWEDVSSKKGSKTSTDIPITPNSVDDFPKAMAGSKKKAKLPDFGEMTDEFQVVVDISEKFNPAARNNIAFLKRRLDIEETYVKSLTKLAATRLKDDPNSPMLAQRLNMENTKKMASTHRHLAVQLDDIIKEMTEKCTLAEQARKELVNEGNQMLKDLQSAYQSSKKAQDAFASAKADAEEADDVLHKAKNNPNMKSKQLGKLESKAADSQAKATMLLSTRDEAAKDAVICQRHHYSAAFPGLLRRFQEYEQQRCEDQMKYLQSLSKATAALVAGTEALSRGYEKAVGRMDTYLEVDVIAGQETPAPPTSVCALQHPTLAGPLDVWVGDLKKGSFQHRHVVLKEDDMMLHVYKDTAALDTKQVITLMYGDNVVRPVDDSLYNTPNVFMVKESADTIYFRAESQESWDEWMGILTKTVTTMKHLRNKPTAKKKAKPRIVRSVNMKIEQAKGLSSKGEYFCILAVDADDQARTSATVGAEPYWGEVFLIDDIPPIANDLVVTVKREMSGLSGIFKGKGKDLIGSCVVPISQSRVAGMETLEDWYLLEKNDEEVGSIWLIATFTNELVFPLEVYCPLDMVIVEDNVGMLYTLATKINVHNRERLAQHLLKVFESRGDALAYVINTIKQELGHTEESNLIFRQNNLTTKTIELFMKQGAEACVAPLEEVVKKISDSGRSCEVYNTESLTPKEVAANWKRLLSYSSDVWKAIMHAMDKCPAELRAVFSHIKTATMKQFPDAQRDVVTLAISGFVFNRMFGPCIQNPKLYGLLPEHPRGQAKRTFTLISKIVVKLGNLKTFGKKEKFMDLANPWVEERFDDVRTLLDRYATKPAPANLSGSMIKFHKPGTSNASSSVDVARHLAAFRRIIEENLEGLANKEELKCPEFDEVVRAVEADL